MRRLTTLMLDTLYLRKDSAIALMRSSIKHVYAGYVEVVDDETHGDFWHWSSRVWPLESLVVGGIHQTSHGKGWPLRHDEVRTALHPLIHLRHLAFNADTYINDYPGSDFKDPNGGQNFWKPQSLLIDEEEKYLLGLQDAEDDVRTIFDRVHLHRMLQVATRCSEEFPELEWLFLGGYPIAIQDGRPEALSDQRIFGMFLFQYMFGVSDIVFQHNPKPENVFGSMTVYKASACVVM